MSDNFTSLNTKLSEWTLFQWWMAWNYTSRGTKAIVWPPFEARGSECFVSAKWGEKKHEKWCNGNGSFYRQVSFNVLKFYSREFHRIWILFERNGLAITNTKLPERCDDSRKIFFLFRVCFHSCKCKRKSTVVVTELGDCCQRF